MQFKKLKKFYLTISLVDCPNDANKIIPAYKNLVTVEKPSSLCSPIDESSIRKFKKPGDTMGLGEDYDVFAGPKVKGNNYMKETEKYDQIVYFFDYLDVILQERMVQELSALLEEARKVPEEDENEFDDPYSLEKLLFYFSGGTQGRDPWKNTDKRFQKGDASSLKNLMGSEKYSQWEKGFSAGKISNIIKAFGWGTIPSIPYYFKRLIDKYNFSGTGRLNAQEFLFLAIWENYKTYAQCRKFCFKSVIEEIIDPLFQFLDCDNDGYINSENIWEGFKFLDRKNQKGKFDYYQCVLPRAFNKFYRTHAPNDFILKNYNSADGYLSREEFRKGILLGYWERQVQANGVVPNDQRNKKDDRWGGNGTIDRDCQGLLQMYRMKN